MCLNITYTELSKPIKDQVLNYFDLIRNDNPRQKLSDSIDNWFTEHFDEWMLRQARIRNFDRRKNNGQNGAAHADLRSDRRRHNDRFDIEIPVKSVETLYDSTFDDKIVEKSIKSILDMNLGRLYFKWDSPLKASSMVNLSIDFSNIDRELKNLNAIAMVIRSDKLSDGKYRILVIFSNITDGKKINLSFHIFKNLVYQQSPLYRLFYHN
jgi:hypothetical protein